MSIYNYLLAMIYKFIILKHSGYSFETNLFNHSATEYCLLETLNTQNDIIQMINSAHVCRPCLRTIAKKSIRIGFFDIMKKELKSIKKSTFYKIRDWIKLHPIIALLVLGLFTIFLNLLSNFIYELLRTIFS